MFEDTYRRMNDRLEPSERLVQSTLYAMQPRRRFSMRRVTAVALAFALCLMVTTSALAANVPEFNSWLYKIAPDVALYFRPVSMADENNGVRMEVEAIRIAGREAQIYVTVTDLVGGRLDETIDLFDSYGLDLPGHSSAYCNLVNYDEEKDAATFLIVYSSEKLIDADKVTFSLHRMLTQKKTTSANIYLLDYKPLLDGDPETIIPGSRMRGGGYCVEAMNEYGFDDMEPWEMFDLVEQLPVLKPERISVELTEGVHLTGLGYVDGKLHIQIHYDDIIVSDNHGFSNLETAQGERIYSYLSVAFWDDDHTGSYENYIYDVPPDELQGLRMLGQFVTCKTLVEGPWSVTFPLEEIP